MAVTVPKIIEQILDNANLGKIVTDVGSGFALSLSLLMLIGLHTGMSIIPADRIKSLNDQVIAQLAVVNREMDAFCTVPGIDNQSTALTCPDDGSTVGDPLETDARNITIDRPAVYFEARQAIARYASTVDGFDKRIAAESKRKDGGNDEDITDWTGESADATEPLDALITHRDSVDEEIQRLETLLNDFEDARSLKSNLEVLGSHITELLAISVILGVLLSQVNRLLFVRFIFDGLLSKTIPHYAFTRNALTPVNDQEDQNRLVSQYYRYTEGAINLIGPVLAFGWYFPQYANAKLVLEGGDISHGKFFFWSCVLAALLLLSGFYTYKSFRKKCSQEAGIKRAALQRGVSRQSGITLAADNIPISSTVEVNFEVKKTGNVTKIVFAIDDDRLNLDNDGKASIPLTRGRHYLRWDGVGVPPAGFEMKHTPATPESTNINFKDTTEDGHAWFDV